MRDFTRTLFEDERVFESGAGKSVRKVEVTFQLHGQALVQPNIIVGAYLYGPRGGFQIGTPSFSIDEFWQISKNLEKAEDEYDQFVRENS